MKPINKAKAATIQFIRTNYANFNDYFFLTFIQYFLITSTT